MQTQEQQFTKGFNNGYLLAKHEPELANKLISSKNENSDYFKGLVLGKKEHDIEKVRKQFKTAVKDESTINKQISKGKER